MENETDKKVILKNQGCLRTYKIKDLSGGIIDLSKYQIKTINLYNDKGIIYKTRSGWFEDYLISSDKIAVGITTDLNDIKIDKPKKALKEDFKRKDNYFITSKVNYAFEQKEGYVNLYLYIDNINIKVGEIETFFYYENDTEKVFYKLINLEINGVKFLEYSDTFNELKPIGERVKALLIELKDIIHDNDKYAIEKFLTELLKKGLIK